MREEMRSIDILPDIWLVSWRAPAVMEILLQNHDRDISKDI